MTTTGQARNYYPALRIFVFGQEVTEDVLSCSVTYQDGRAPNTAKFVLANAPGEGSRSAVGEDRYVVTEKDIQALYNDVTLDNIRLPERKETLIRLAANAQTADDQLSVASNVPGLSDVAQASQVAARESYRTAVRSTTDDVIARIQQRLSASVVDDVKRRILTTKIAERQVVKQPDFTDVGTAALANIREVAELAGDALRYPLTVGDCIFHTNDPVRIFWRDPGNPGVWYHMFAGFVSDWTERVTADNERTVELVCEDVSRVLRYARLATNPGIFDISAISEQQDDAIRTFFSNGFARLSLIEILFTIVFGSAKSGTSELLRAAGQALPEVRTFSYRRVSVNGTTDDEIPSDGAGSFNFSRSVAASFGPLSEQEAEIETAQELLTKLTATNSLPVYQAWVDHQVRESDMDDLLLRPEKNKDARDELRNSLRRDNDNRARIEDVITAVGEHPELFPVDNGKLVVLAPASLGPSTNRKLLLEDLVGPASNTTWSSRLALIYDLVERIDFSFYASPKGDLICEMPLYDMQPKDFRGPVSAAQLRSTQQLEIALEQDEVRGPFEPHYVIPKSETISWERGFSDEHVRTQMLCWPNAVIAYQEDIPSVKLLGQPPEVVTLRALVPQFGVRSEQADPRGLIATREAAQIYAQVKLNQLNADARSAHVEILPRISLGFPNRPLEFEERKYIATVRSITHNIVWNSDMTTTLDVNYVRGWAGQVDDDDDPVYEPLGGFASAPLNYAIKLGIKETPKTSTKSLGDATGGVIT